MLPPKKKISLHKKRVRHSTRQTINLKRLTNKYRAVTCENCSGLRHPHRVCNSCGFYNGKQVLTIKTKSKEKIIDA
ncbi:MAG: 50S ribosomal protein L32 [Candidatus Absconditabacterales bacterium]